MSKTISALFLCLYLAACGGVGDEDDATVSDSGSSAEQASEQSSAATEPKAAEGAKQAVAEPRPEIYSEFTLESDLGHLSDDQRRMVAVLIDASRIMDELFWHQAFGERDALLEQIDDEPTREFARINYGPWDRLAGNRPFVPGYGPKPSGANFYPADMSDAEFEALEDSGKDDLYTLIRRDEAGELTVEPYNEFYAERLADAAEMLERAAELAENESFAHYLRLRADALVTNRYQPSDLAWMDVEGNKVDLIYGPIETYEDQRYGYKAAFEAYVLIKDLEWSERLARFAEFLPELQRNLPVPEAYKAEEPGGDAELNAYDVVYYAGDSNAGSKTIAVNLPNDEEVQLAKGTRRSQLKNAMRAKFDRILLPIADVVIAEDQREHISFDAFFGNTMFHEVAHGLGIKNLVEGEGTVRAALKEHASPHEEGKADVLGLYMVRELSEAGELEGDIMDYYVTFLAGIFRSVRFGASSAHGRANMMRFNYFADFGAFERDENGHYRVVKDRFSEAIDALSREILVMQGDGDYDKADRMLDELGVIGEELQSDLDRIDTAGIPVDVKFRQGKDVLGIGLE
ncbi:MULTISPECIES: dipeptidyl-peptidase 3 family protein [unclassified Wenzhouxiangella]|uniref:dipeptidyl-peptidase 3 family protein n=1 Tax=unclassified Wenzhouxiangella TaxID=2613841 RepID=UPI000E32A0EB|nr:MULTISPECIES: Zn-dependent hydrolase [unclassified Wenzhouxiangella]RFF26393.1 Zn-dependent hydrolase [Wenzhouxiangella sp. 15181]RFP67335.1 Zn-dependent hydrolase [Wenzhouxiangella sp. 15190]